MHRAKVTAVLGAVVLVMASAMLASAHAAPARPAVDRSPLSTSSRWHQEPVSGVVTSSTAGGAMPARGTVMSGQPAATPRGPSAAPPPVPVTSAALTSSPVPATPSSPNESAPWGCQAAVSYLAAHAAPGFSFVCPGYAFGRQGMTCVDDPPYCGAGQQVIVIADPCPAAYMNEASNSLVFAGLSDAPIDPYGYCPS